MAKTSGTQFALRGNPLPHAGYRKISGVASRRLAGDGTAADHVFYGIPSGAMAERPQGRRTARPCSIRQQWVPLKRIAPALRQAVVTSEDDLFWKHDGFNFSQMYDALKRNWDKGRMAAGGSTISQQLAKNLWFTPERSILRKLKEAIMTWRLELALDKERILELYLNVAEWGNGVYGAEAAARHYFGKSAASLSRGEAARLAVMLPSPLRRTPSSAIVKRLSSRLLKRMPR